MDVFDSDAERYSFWIERVNPPHYHRVYDTIIPRTAGLALDVGAGPGHLSFFLAGRARHVIGLDLSPGMVRVARRRQRDLGIANITFLQGDVYALPLAPASLDLIATDSVLHDTAIEHTLPALISRLKPGGLLLVRDLVAAHPRRARSPLWQVLRTLKNTPRYVRRVGAKETLQLLKFELDPRWIRHKCEGPNMPPDRFRAFYRAYLPGCRFLEHGWAMSAVWIKADHI